VQGKYRLPISPIPIIGRVGSVLLPKETCRPLIEEIAEAFYRITLPMPFRLDHIQSFALVSGQQVTLFATVLDIPEGFSTLEGDLQRIGRSIADIGRIFLTHYHADHCGLAGRLKEISGARIYLSEVDSEAISNQNR